MKKIFFDTEFTGLHKNTTLISIGLVSDCGKTFYAELTDYDRTQIDGWLTDNVIHNLTMSKDYSVDEHYEPYSDHVIVRGDKDLIENTLHHWLINFDEKLEIWSDTLAYDWVLFCDIFGHAFKIPDVVYYIPFDLATLMKIEGVDPDISREEFSGRLSVKHNALEDAITIKCCYSKIIRLKNQQ